MRRPVAVLVGALVAVALNGCGNDEPSGTPPIAAPTPTPTVTVGQFTGNFTGTVALDAGRTGAVSLMVQNDAHATGTLTISGAGMADVVVPLTGSVDLIGGNFSLSGRGDSVSGTLPGSSGGTGFLAVQIGTNTNPFHGTIQRV